MHDQGHLTRARARRLLDAHLLRAVHGPSLPLSVTALHVHGEPIPIGEVHRRAAEFVPFRAGDAWGAAWDTTWFRLAATIPADWASREVVARLALGYAGQTGFGAEALLWQGDSPAQGISPDHDEICVARPAHGGEPVDLLVEAAANPAIDQNAATWPLLLPDPGGIPLFTLQRAEFCVIDRAVEAFCSDLRLVLDLSTLLGDTGWRAGVLLDALRTACMLVDPEHMHDSDALAAAHQPLRDVLADTGPNRRHRVVAVGYAHIDTAWLWPVRETRRKCARSFSTVLSLMDEDPDFRFAASQMQQYAWVRDDYPELYARIKQRVAEGRWEPVGGMWVESDANIASAESLVRQVLHGTLFLLDEFGVQPRVGWLPDTFGFPATLPQILADAGMPYFMTQKISWNQTNTFPHSTFWWEGLDGSRVLTHMPPVATYNGDVSPGEVLRSERDFRDHRVSSSSLYPFGLGDGGGGPTRAMLQRAHRMRDLDGLPRLELGTTHDFFVRIEADDLPSWRGELYLERHRGVFTTQARIKHDNRLAERLLREAETWSALRPDGRHTYPAKALDEAWKLTLLHQFHDILPGTSIHAVYDEAARDHRRVHDVANAAIDNAVRAIAACVDTNAMRTPAVVFNATTHARAWHRYGVTVPGLGYATVDLAATAEQPPGITATADSIDNGILRITWDTTTGLLTSIFDRQAQREVLAPQARGNVLQVFKDHPTDYDAWEIDADDLRTPHDLTECDSIDISDEGLRTVRRYGTSTITQTMTLLPGERRIDFHTSVDWQESHRLLKVAFPVDVHATHASYDVQFGHVERPTHEDTSWDAAQFEVPAHRFADLSEPGYGVALLNDGKHGYDVRGTTLRLTLLRAATAPDPTADRGTHRFTYALLPHPGDVVAGRVAEHAEAWELPLRVVTTTPHPGDLPPAASLVAVESQGAAHVVVTAVKKSERGEALVVRLCEVAGGRGTARIRVPQATQATRCDVIERPREPLAVDDGSVILEFRPFQLATLRFDQLSRHTSGDDR